MLHCALLAYGSAFSDNPELRSPALRAEFARYAKQWLDYEFERPVMGLVRALALLAEYHCGIGEWGTGYMYMGMSIRATQLLIQIDNELRIGSTASSGLVERDWHFCKGSSDSRKNTPGQAGGGSSMQDRSIKMVNRATRKIVHLLQMFEEQHSMMFFPRNMIHVIYECGIVLLKDAITAPLAATKKRAIVLEAVSACLRALRGTSKTWPWADRLANQLEGNLNEIKANK
ncbi:hypothetical protein RSOL_218040 [Rhizoctonia solani AG-3 Rhs1AP]|uniref:Fungal specific transcription factor domain protein n=2 Tax=Rhizoctonia solani AG-3 TaxID=1086053 RepID=A0A074S687_9AGAM|nr:hypothetical protein RSOL_218040 [Rhizoctonia solani AG-3 Rhs1AP]KEP45582.1 hypothetical protein V565_258340 [Rhizoctonia solani 123E]